MPVVDDVNPMARSQELVVSESGELVGVRALIIFL